MTCCLLLLTQLGQAQESKLDSMISSLSEMKEDTHKMLLLIDIGVIYLNQSEYTLANSYFKQSFVISEKQNHKKGRGLYYCDSGLVDYYLSQYSDALSKFYIALNIFKTLNDRKATADTYSNIGMVYGAQGRFPRRSRRCSSPEKEKPWREPGLSCEDGT